MTTHWSRMARTNVLIAITGAAGDGIAVLDLSSIAEPSPLPYAISSKCRPAAAERGVCLDKAARRLAQAGPILRHPALAQCPMQCVRVSQLRAAHVLAQSQARTLSIACAPRGPERRRPNFTMDPLDKIDRSTNNRTPQIGRHRKKDGKNCRSRTKQPPRAGAVVGY